MTWTVGSSLQKRRLRGDLVEAFQCLKGAPRKQKRDSLPLSRSFITAVEISSCTRACGVEEPEGVQVPAEMRALLVPEPRSARQEMFSSPELSSSSH